MSKSGFGKFLVGASIGFGVGLLLAAKPGKETRNDIKNKFKELEKKVKELDYSELKDGALNKLDDLKIKIEDLDKEQVFDFTKQKIADIKSSLDDFSKSVKKKSAPIIKKLVDELSEKLDKYEQSSESANN